MEHGSFFDVEENITRLSPIVTFSSRGKYVKSVWFPLCSDIRWLVICYLDVLSSFVYMLRVIITVITLMSYIAR